MKTKIPELQKLASEIIGDDKRPELFFVSMEGVIITVTRNFNVAYNEWKNLPRSVETALETRSYGTICDTSPNEEGSKILRTWDDSQSYHRIHEFN